LSDSLNTKYDAVTTRKLLSRALTYVMVEQPSTVTPVIGLITQITLK